MDWRAQPGHTAAPTGGLFQSFPLRLVDGLPQLFGL